MPGKNKYPNLYYNQVTVSLIFDLLYFSHQEISLWSYLLSKRELILSFCFKGYFMGWISKLASFVTHSFVLVSVIQFRRILAIWLVWSSGFLVQTRSRCLISWLIKLETLILTFCSVLKLCSYLQFIKTKYKDERI